MTNMICLDESYSTTRLVTQEQPVVVNNPEDKFETVLFLPPGENRNGDGGLRTRGYFKKSFDDKPLITIITVVYNGENYIEETIQSVINQTYDNMEYIIIDGRSTDRTVDIIKKYEDTIDYWVSENDKGIYDAMNKGINLCGGEIIGIINADDWYEKNIFHLIASQYIKFNDQSIFHGNMNIIKDGSFYYTSKPPMDLSLLKKGMILNHPTVFTSVSIYKKLGLFSTVYKITSDWNLMLKSYLCGINFIYLDHTIANFRLGGTSFIFDTNHALEKHLVRKENKIFTVFDIYYLFDKIKIKLFGRYLSGLSSFKKFLWNK